MQKKKVAFIGAGRMAEEHIKAFSDISDIEIVGIHSRSFGRALLLAKKYGFSKCFDSIYSLYCHSQADLVVIAVSESSVNKVCKEVFNYPWRVLVEKPAGINLSDAEDIVVAANRSGRDAYVALNRRHYSSTRAVSKELEAIEGQRLVQVFDQENPIVALESGQPPLVVENWMYANSIHIIDYFQLFCRGEVLDIEHVLKWNPNEPRFVLAKIQYSSGDIGIYQAIWNGPGPWAVSVTTQAKRWEMRPLEQASWQLYKSKKNISIPVHSWDLEFKPGLRLQAEHTVKALRGQQHSMPTLADGLETMRLVSRIYEA